MIDEGLRIVDFVGGAGNGVQGLLNPASFLYYQIDSIVGFLIPAAEL